MIIAPISMIAQFVIVCILMTSSTEKWKPTFYTTLPTGEGIVRSPSVLIQPESFARGLSAARNLIARCGPGVMAPARLVLRYDLSIRGLMDQLMFSRVDFLRFGKSICKGYINPSLILVVEGIELGCRRRQSREVLE